MDWFVVVTPLLLIPILALFAFVGCSLLFSSSPYPTADVIIDVSFFPKTLDSNASEYKIVIKGLDSTGEFVREGDPPDEKKGGKATYRLKLSNGEPLSARAGEKLTVRCKVFDPGDLDVPIVRTEPPHCEPEFEEGETYLLTIEAAAQMSTFVCAPAVLIS